MKMKIEASHVKAAAIAAVACVCMVSSANAAGLTLTAAGTALGFSTSTVVVLNPGNTGCCSGPFGVAVSNNGNLIISDNGARYAFSDVDNQVVTDALNSTPSGSGTQAYASAGGQAYGGIGGSFAQFNNDGTINHVLTGVTVSPYLGMWGNPVNGHIIATSSAGLIDIDPLAAGGAGTFRVINGQFGDGVSISPDGATVYLEQGTINSYDIATGNFIAAFGVPGGPDGTGVIQSTNSLNGQVIVNSNNGGVYLLDPLLNVVTLIATQATRGDYVSPDVSNGTLLLTYSDAVERLSCGPNCGIGSSATPEPSTMVLFGVPMMAIGFIRRKLRKQN